MVRGIAVMRRRTDSYVNATQILKVAGVDKGRRTKILEKEILPGKHEIVQGGYGKYQGTWYVPYKADVSNTDLLVGFPSKGDAISRRNMVSHPSSDLSSILFPIQIPSDLLYLRVYLTLPLPPLPHDLSLLPHPFLASVRLLTL